LLELNLKGEANGVDTDSSLGCLGLGGYQYGGSNN
jgi:hypothetical protein